MEIKEGISKGADSLVEKAKSKKIDLPFGFPSIDGLYGGLYPGEFIVIGGRPSSGKSSFAMSIAWSLAKFHKKKIGYFHLEGTEKSLMDRLIAMDAHVDIKRIRMGIFRSQDMVSIVDSASRIYDTSTFYFFTPHHLNLGDLEEKARKLKAEEGIEALFIDYIGLIGPEMIPSVARYEQMGVISRSLRRLAIELEIPIVVTSQMGRRAEERNLPELSDLRDTGDLEQDADMVIILHRTRPIENDWNYSEGTTIKTTQGYPIEVVKAIVAKYRYGSTGTFELGFQPQLMKFVELESITENLSGDSKEGNVRTNF